MSGYLSRERDRPPMTRETRIGNAVIIVGTILVLFCTLVTVRAIPALAPLHGKVSPAMPAMWLLGGTFIIRAGAHGSGERWSPRALRIAGWSIVAASTAVMILAAIL